MELQFLMLADAAEVSGGKMFILGGGWNVFYNNQRQGSHVTMLAAALSLGWAELGNEHTFVVDLEEAGQRLGQIASGTFSMPKPTGDSFVKHQTFMLAVPIEVTVKPGSFRVKLVVDGKALGSVNYSVVDPRVGQFGKGFVGSS